MNDRIIFTETLQAMSGLTRARDVEKWCEKNGIGYFPGRHGPCTTIDLLNAARGLLVIPPELRAEDIIP